jgi:hypothetical protein
LSGPQENGNPVARLTLFPSGPLHCGQFSSSAGNRAASAVKHKAAAERLIALEVIILGSWRGRLAQPAGEDYNVTDGYTRRGVTDPSNILYIWTERATDLPKVLGNLRIMLSSALPAEGFR